VAKRLFSEPLHLISIVPRRGFAERKFPSFSVSAARTGNESGLKHLGRSAHVAESRSEEPESNCEGLPETVEALESICEKLLATI
jgi:hypothetical protein